MLALSSKHGIESGYAPSINTTNKLSNAPNSNDLNSVFSLISFQTGLILAVIGTLFLITKRMREVISLQKKLCNSCNLKMTTETAAPTQIVIPPLSASDFSPDTNKTYENGSNANEIDKDLIELIASITDGRNQGLDVHFRFLIEISKYGLSRQERKIAYLVLLLKSGKIIAHDLRLAESTVRFHMKGILEKTGCSSRDEFRQMIFVKLFGDYSEKILEVLDR